MQYKSKNEKKSHSTKDLFHIIKYLTVPHDNILLKKNISMANMKSRQVSMFNNIWNGVRQG